MREGWGCHSVNGVLAQHIHSSILSTVVTHACRGGGDSEVQSDSELHSKYEGVLGYLRSCLGKGREGARETFPRRQRWGLVCISVPLPIVYLIDFAHGSQTQIFVNLYTDLGDPVLCYDLWRRTVC